MLSAIYIIILIFAGFMLASNTASIIKSKIIYLVLFEHLLFSYFYYLFSLTGPADANGYFVRAKFNQDFWGSFDVGTDFITFLTTIPVKYLHFSLLNSHLLFGLFGFIGFTYFIKLLYNNKSHILGFPTTAIIVLLPGFHFWTSALGKDSIFFMGLMMFFYSLTNYKKNKLKLMLSLVLIGLIRPHMLMIIIISILISLLLKSPKNFSLGHIVMLILVTGFIIALLPFMMKFVDIEELSVDTIGKRIEEYNSLGKGGNGVTSNIDVTGYSLPAKMFAYLFRPFFYDARSLFQIIASFENLLLIYIILSLSIKINLIKWYKHMAYNRRIMLIYIFTAWLVLSINMYNLGLASRQKYMIIPVIFLLLFSLSYTQMRYYKQNIKK